MHEMVRKAWTAIGINTSVKGVDRALYMEHYRTGDMEVGQWGWDRASANKADPGRWLGTIDDGPWAPTYGHWYDQNAWKKEEPPQDHMIRKIWDFWEKCRTEPDEAKGHALFMQIIKAHRDAPVAVGVVEFRALIDAAGRFDGTGERWQAPRPPAAQPEAATSRARMMVSE